MVQVVPADRPMTYDDLLALPEDGLRHELIDGIHYVSPSPVTRHQAAVGRMYRTCADWADDHGGRCYVSPMDVKFSELTVLEPDVLLLGPDRVPFVGEKNIGGPPDIAIEVSSPSTASHDLIRKRRVYEQHGVREFWFVDLEDESITQYVLDGERYDDPVTHRAGDVMASRFLDGLAIDVEVVLAAR